MSDLPAPAAAEPVFRSLRAQLLMDLGFLTSAAVLVVGVTTATVLGGDLRAAALPLAALWGGSTLVFAVFGMHVIRRVVLAPVARLAEEAKTLAEGDFTGSSTRYPAAELEHLAGRYRAMAAELLDVQAHVVRVEKLAGIGQLAAGVAHEIRNPLGALATYVEVLRRRGAAGDLTAAMQQAIERMDRTVESLLAYARPGDAAGECDGNAAVRTAVEFLTTQGALAGHDVTLELAAATAPVRGARHAIEQVIVNLVLNAAQARPDGRIVVGTVRRPYEGDAAVRRAADTVATAVGTSNGTTPDGIVRRPRSTRPRRLDIAPGTPGLLLYVADDGPGVPDALRERIFDPFFTTKDPGEGTGLGLAIVARTVHEAGGVVWVDPARQGGAVFKVFLPLATVTTDARADC